MRLDFYVRSSNPPAPLLQATCLGLRKSLTDFYKCFCLTFAETCPFRVGLSHKKFLSDFGYEILAHDPVAFGIWM